MSEKKTAEIKLRIEPSVKAQWQQSAADEGIGLSEWIGKNCSAAVFWAKQNQKMNGTALIDSAIKYLQPDYPQEAGAEIVTASLQSRHKICEDGYACLAPDCSCPKDAVPTSEAEKKFGEDWKPWGDAA